MDQAKVVDMTVAELRSLIKEVVSETILEILSDPEKGRKLRRQFGSARGMIKMSEDFDELLDDFKPYTQGN